MNVLIFVTTLLMLLSMLTYSRMGIFLNSQLTQITFEKYMNSWERASYDLEAKKLYNRLKKTEKNTPDTQPQKETIKASPNISMKPLFDATLKKSNPKQLEQTRILLKNLMLTLFSNEKWFQQALNERSSLLDELLDSIEQTAEKLPNENQIKKINQLESLKLEDKQLDLILYKMLRTSPYIDLLDQKNENPEDTLESGGEPQETEIKDFQSPKGYRSLLDFVNLSPHSRVRIYLSSPVVLESIFQNKDLVKDIIKERKRLYQQAKNEKDLKPFSDTFEAQFSNSRQRDIDPTSLDFSVSKTNPKDYE